MFKDLYLIHWIILPFNYNDKLNLNTRTLISVPKSKIKTAVNRNLIKRRIKESYRTNKAIIKNHSLLIAFIYTLF